MYPLRGFVVFLAAAMPLAQADVRLPNVFKSHMVLQRGLECPVWGWTDVGEHVTVEFSGSRVNATADEHGRWRIKLATMEANSKSRSLVISGSNRIELKDVLVGDVWICSGQSNMEWPMRSVVNAEKEVAAADHTGIRLFDVPGHTTSALPQEDVPGGNWNVCSPQSVGNFSAVGYFFARHFHAETGVPVGLLGTNWGGTRIEPWVPAVGFRNVPELKSITDQVDRFDPTVPAGKATWTAYANAVERWTTELKAAIKTGVPLPSIPATPGYTNSGQPMAIYHSMVHGLAPFGIRGVLWYQGESNGGEGVEYFHKMQALIGGWRNVWNQENFPIYFYFVQLANWQRPNDNPAGGDGWARIRDAQTQSLTVPNTGMAVITDIGVANDIHPRNKQDVGQRLALWALRDVAKKHVVVSGPLYREMRADTNSIRLHFDHADSGLIVGVKDGLKPTTVAENGTLTRFAIAGEDKQLHWANARIDGDTVIVSSSEVTKPVAVRYAWSMNPEGANLYNKVGLPASPFRTDNW